MEKFLPKLLQLLFTNNVPSSLIPISLVMEATHSFEPSDLIRATRSYIPEDGIFLSKKRFAQKL
jgi:hypothetical protein